MIYPLDKKILKSCAILEIQHQTDFVEKFLRDRFFELSDDCKSIYLALVNRYKSEIPVGNYGGLAVGLQVLYQHLGIEKSLIMGEQLKKRNLDDPTSSKKWSAKILLGDRDAVFKLGNYYVNLADGVRKTWNDKTKLRKMMNRPDENIKRIMDYYFKGKNFPVDNSEIAVSKAILDEKNTNKLIVENPSWKNHETNRTETILSTLKEYHNGKIITTDDPRIIMSIVIRSKLEEQEIKVVHPTCVTKIFPRFWESLN